MVGRRCFLQTEKDRRRDTNLVGKAEALLDKLDSLLQGFHSLLKLTIRKLDERARLDEFMLDSCLQLVDSLMKGLMPFDDQIDPVQHVLIKDAPMSLCLVKLLTELIAECLHFTSEVLPERDGKGSRLLTEVITECLHFTSELLPDGSGKGIRLLTELLAERGGKTIRLFANFLPESAFSATYGCSYNPFDLGQ